MWLLALVFSRCMDATPCEPQYVYVAEYTTREACEAKIVGRDSSLMCVKE